LRRARAALAGALALGALACRSAAAPAGPEAGVQVLYRAELATPEGDADLRLVLRQWSAHRFELVASDRAGRALWRLAVDGARGRVDGGSRARRCRFDPARPLELPRFALPVAGAELPALLAGRPPEPPPGEPPLALSRTDGGLRLEAPERELTLRWRERARSPLGGPAPPLAVESDLPDCRDLDLS
jgi:hypothetical protein